MVVNKISILLSLIFFNAYTPKVCFSQNEMEKRDIQSSIYINFIHYASHQISSKELLTILERNDGTTLNQEEYAPLLQQMNLFPYCVADIDIKELYNFKYKTAGIIYEYDISNVYDCYTKQNTKLSISCTIKSLASENQYHNINKVSFPNLVFRKGLIFYDLSAKHVCFVSGYLNKSPINSFFETQNISNDELSKLVSLRYSNYLPQNITVISNKKIKKVRFQSEYTTLENVYFTVEFKNNFEIENFSFEKKER